MKRISNYHIQDYLEEHECYPVYREYEIAYYKPTKQFFLLLDSYFIKYEIVKTNF